MIYLYPICLRCGEEKKLSSLITRAKASLIIARYLKNCKYICIRCQNLEWNEDCQKWEIEKGITLDQLPEESREILEETSKLRKLFKP